MLRFAPVVLSIQKLGYVIMILLFKIFLFKQQACIYHHFLGTAVSFT